MATRTGQDYVVELIGFNQPIVKMYNHKDAFYDGSDKVWKPAGTVMKEHRVGTTTRLSKPEKDYFTWAALVLGWMPWPPGEECLKQPFPFSDKDELLETNAPRGRAMGCPACRSKLKEADAVGVQTPSGESASITPIASPNKVECKVCGYEPRTHTAKGKPHKDSTRRNHLAAHMAKKHISHPSG